MNTKDRLRGRVVTLNHVLKRPLSYMDNGVIQVGHFMLEHNSSMPYPYKLVEVVSTGGAEKTHGESMKAGEVATFLDGLFMGLQLTK